MCLRFFIFLVFLCFQYSGYAKKKPCNFHITIQFPEGVERNIRDGKYLGLHSDNAYLSAFIDAYMEIIIKKDITVVQQNDTLGKPYEHHFIINLSRMRLYEKIEESVFKDSTGREYDRISYRTCHAEMYMNIQEFKGRMLRGTEIYSGNSEEVSTKRNIVEWLLKAKQGTAHLKELPDNAFIRICEKCGKEAARTSLRMISRTVKRQEKGKEFKF
jgi:hypothetical protein